MFPRKHGFLFIHQKANIRRRKNMEKVIDVANKKVEELGMDLGQYGHSIKREGRYWKVMYRLKSRRVRGGGVDILVDGSNPQVFNIVRYQ